MISELRIRYEASSAAARTLERALEHVATGWVTEPLLVSEIRRDPVPLPSRLNSHLYVVAQPAIGLRATLPDDVLDDAVRAAGSRVPRGGELFPGWRQLTHRERRPGGTVGYSGPGLSHRRFRPGTGEERALIDVEVAASGGVSLFSGRGSDRHTPTGTDVLMDAAVVTLTRSVATLAGLIGYAVGFDGPWRIAMAVSDVAGKPSVHALHKDLPVEPTPLTTMGYARATDTTTEELLARPDLLARQLTGPLLRALGTSHEYRLRSLRTAWPP